MYTEFGKSMKIVSGDEELTIFATTEQEELLQNEDVLSLIERVITAVRRNDAYALTPQEKPNTNHVNRRQKQWSDEDAKWRAKVEQDIRTLRAELHYVTTGERSNGEA